MAANWKEQEVEALLEWARPFLRGELERVDKDLPRLVSVLHGAGASECWHKHGSFFDHLLGVYRVLKLWKAPEAVCLCGLFHSAYSNSNVSLAIFPPSPSGRDTVRAHIGPAAERLTHLFCVAPRQRFIDHFLRSYADDEELSHHLRSSEAALRAVRAGGGPGEDRGWMAKLRSACPPEGITVKHARTGEDLLIPRRVVAVFLLMAVADLSEHFFSFQDVLFDNRNGRLELEGSNALTALWPGEDKPGLWMSHGSRVAAIYNLIVRDEEIYLAAATAERQGQDEELELVVPPVFEGCTRVVDAKEQIAARDLYWKVVCGAPDIGLDGAEEMLVDSVAKNPFAAEGHVVLAQIYLGKGEFHKAEESARRGLRLLLEWGSPWDKRMTWQGWVAWARVLLNKAKERSWPQTAWGIVNLGLVV